LRVVNQLQPLQSGGFDWHAVGDDPQFLFHKRLPHRGWNMIELALDHSEPSATVTFYFDTGHGFREEESIFLPLKQGRITKRLFYLPATLKGIRFDPMESQGKFSIRHFNFVWMPPFFVQDRLAQRIANMHHLYRGLTKQDVIQRLKKEARETGSHWREVASKYYDETFVKHRASPSYAGWIEKVEKPSLATVRSMPKLNDEEREQQPELFALRPLISILLPTYNSDELYLRQCIDSVLAQSYPHWQLCIADDASTQPQVAKVLREYAVLDARVRYTLRESNGHISAASNSAFLLAEGDFIALLDHDDLLAEHALYYMVKAINKQPDAKLLYSDEDKIDAQGKRFDPHFKPDWNPDLLLSQNYICHLSVFKTELIREIGGFRIGVEGSQDHDLILRAVHGLSPDQIVHIPRVLYHWRAIEGSTASQASEKSYTTAAGVEALRYYFTRDQQLLDEPLKDADRTGPRRSVAVEPGMLANTYRIRWPLPESPPLVSLLIPTRDGYEILKQCVDSVLQKTTYTNFEILVLDNQSRCPQTLDYLEQIARDSRVSVHRWDQPFNYSSINNFGATLAKGAVLGLLNNDVEVINADWLDEMVSQACRDQIGCVGAMLYYPNETVQHAGVILGIGGVAGHGHKYFSRNEHGYFSRLKLVQNLSAVTGACLVVRKDVFDQVGGLDEENLAVAFNDVDLCLKVREAGYRNLWTPYAELYHHESVSRGADDTQKKRNRARREAEYMRQRWGASLDTDPAYNPNLTLVHEDFSLR
tara:strand:+ start:9782 stop:12067 length:2286 start_codon:yes stop_codon:yes gene_type:complete